MATWLQMVKHQPRTGIPFDFMFIPVSFVSTHTASSGAEKTGCSSLWPHFAKAVSLALLEGLIKIRFKKLLEPGSRIHTHV